MLYCTSCKELFCEDELQTYKDAHGFIDGRYEEYDVCPNCGQAEFEKAHKCENCGVYFYDEENDLQRICPACVEDNLTYDILYNATKKNGQKENVEINVFLAELFTPSEIEKILADYMKSTNDIMTDFFQKNPNIKWNNWQCQEFFKSDVDYVENVLADYLKEE